MPDSCVVPEDARRWMKRPSDLVKSEKFAQSLHCGKNYRVQKSGDLVEGCRFFLCKSGSGYSQGLAIVENPCGKNCGQCGKLRVINRYFALLVMGTSGVSGMYNIMYIL